MQRLDINRIDSKRRHTVDPRKKQFAEPAYRETEYPHRLNFYAIPPTADITLEQFEQWAIDRLRSRYTTHTMRNLAGLVWSGLVWENLREELRERMKAAWLTNPQCLSSSSTRRTGSMFLSQQVPGRDGRSHEAPIRKIPATRFQFVFFHQTQL